MKKHYLTLLICILSSFGTVAAQHVRETFLAAWEIAFPTAGNLVTRGSLAGGRAEYRRYLQPDLSVGLGVSWNSFHQYVPRDTYKSPSGNGSVTTDAVKDLYTVPVTASVQYYFNTAGKVKPYIATGLGAQYSEQNVYYNVYGVRNRNWGFVVRPEAGSLIDLDHHIQLYIAGFFNYATNQNDLFDFNHLQHFGINIGFAFW